jgi:hypothetical protein
MYSEVEVQKIVGALSDWQRGSRGGGRENEGEERREEEQMSADKIHIPSCCRFGGSVNDADGEEARY